MEESWCGINCIIANAQEIERGREDVAVFMNNVWKSSLDVLALEPYGLRSRFQWLKYVWW